jgi:hypothetical protein
MADESTTDISKLSDGSRGTKYKSVNTDDILAQNLVQALDHAIKKEKRTIKSDSAERYKMIYYKFYYMKYATIFVYMTMIIFETPTW